jgi:DNA topoisomerase VI subunit B
MSADGMPFAPIPATPKPGRFSNPPVRQQVRRPDTLQLRTLEGTCRMAGVSELRLRRLIAKEVTDNALDECDRDGKPGLVRIERCDINHYVVTDVGRGIDGDAATLADLFSTHRAMQSGKYWRTVSRGVLGNGLRVLCACVALSGGAITVETRGRRTAREDHLARRSRNSEVELIDGIVRG